MNLQITSDTDSVYKPVFREILTDVMGGGTIKLTPVPSDVLELREGQLLSKSSTTDGLYDIVKTASMSTSTAAATSIKLAKNHLFKVGEFIAYEGGSTGATITSITRGTTYDTVVTGTAIGVLALTTKIIQVAAAGATSRSFTASGLLKSTVQVRDNDLTGAALQNVSAGIVLRGVVNESLLPTPPVAADKTALTARVIWE